MTKEALHHIADILEQDPSCIRIPASNITKLRAGTYSLAKLESLVTRMQEHGCGMSHRTNVHPEKIARLKTLSSKKFKVFDIDSSKDNIFHAFLHGISFIVNHHPAPRSRLRESTQKLREKVVEHVLSNAALQNAMTRNVTGGYHAQFNTSYGNGKHSFVTYSKRMQADAFASYTELAALSRYTGVEIHIYDKKHDGYSFLMRYTPMGNARARYVIRLVRSGTGRPHFDLLVPKQFIDHDNFWGHVNLHVFGRKRKHAYDSAQKALDLFKASKENTHRGLPNELVNENKPNRFSWNGPIGLRGPPRKTPHNPPRNRRENIQRNTPTPLNNANNKPTPRRRTNNPTTPRNNTNNNATNAKLAAIIEKALKNASPSS